MSTVIEKIVLEQLGDVDLNYWIQTLKTEQGRRQSEIDGALTADERAAVFRGDIVTATTNVRQRLSTTFRLARNLVARFEQWGSHPSDCQCKRRKCRED